MTPINRPSRMPRFPRAAIVALAFGTLAAAATPAVAQNRQRQQQPAAAAEQYSKPFQDALGPVGQAIEAARTRADVAAARAKISSAQGPAVDAAIGELKALLAPERAKVETLVPLASTPDDKLALGRAMVILGDISVDADLRRRGAASILKSGKADPGLVAASHYIVGRAAFDLKDWPAARTSLQAAVDAGYKDNDIDVMLADAYMNDNQAAQGLGILKQAIDKRKAAGTPPPVSWYRRAINVAFTGQLLDSVVEWTGALSEAYPAQASWGSGINMTQRLGKYSAHEALDLLRLMSRTNSYIDGNDYLRYIEIGDPRRLPDEVLKVIDAGIASGKLKATDAAVSQSKTIASGRIAADRASLPAIERDARKANATGADANSAGDAFLSYGEAAKAEEFYTMAVAKGGIDTDRALTRLGIAQLDQGKHEAAIATFAKVGGVRAPIARLWASYARHKMRPAA